MPCGPQDPPITGTTTLRFSITAYTSPPHTAEKNRAQARDQVMRFIHAAIGGELARAARTCPAECPVASYAITLLSADPFTLRPADPETARFVAYDVEVNCNWRVTLYCHAETEQVGVVPPEGETAVTAVEGCGLLKSVAGTGRGDALVQNNPGHDQMCAEAKRGALDDAFGDASHDVADMSCPERCPQRVLVVRPGTATCSGVKEEWTGPRVLYRVTAEQPWSAQLFCLAEGQRLGVVPRPASDRRTGFILRRALFKFGEAGITVAEAALVAALVLSWLYLLRG
jgi:hypothetical protein